MKVLFAASIIAAGFAISPASAAMMACTGENIGKSVAAGDANAREEAIKTNEHQPVDGTEGLLLGGGSSQNNDLLPQR